MKFKNEIIILLIGITLFLSGCFSFFNTEYYKILSYVFIIGYTVISIGYIRFGYKLKNSKRLLGQFLKVLGFMGLVIGCIFLLIYILGDLYRLVITYK